MTQTQVTKSKLSVFPKFKSHKNIYFVDNFVVKIVGVDVFNLLNAKWATRRGLCWDHLECKHMQRIPFVSSKHKQISALFYTFIVKSRSQCSWHNIALQHVQYYNGKRYCIMTCDYLVHNVLHNVPACLVRASETRLNLVLWSFELTFYNSVFQLVGRKPKLERGAVLIWSQIGHFPFF